MSDKILFQCDYNEGAHPKVLERLVQTNMEQTPGYSEDKYCEEAREKIRKACGDDSLAVHFLVGGTQTNVTVINAALRKHQGVLCAVTGHINVHETGAVEACGHKVLGLESPDGKITAAQVAEAYEAHIHNDSFEHMVQPKMVYISNPTEVGTIYSKAELTALSETCHKYGLYLFLDGARLGYGLAAPDNDLTLPEIAALCDVFYIGGTKVGALFGEAVVIKNPELAQDFRYLIKQNGGMLAKGRLLGLQFDALSQMVSIRRSLPMPLPWRRSCGRHLRRRVTTIWHPTGRTRSSSLCRMHTWRRFQNSSSTAMTSGSMPHTAACDSVPAGPRRKKMWMH